MSAVGGLRGGRFATSKRLILLLSLLALFGGSSLAGIQPAAAVTTTNCTVVGSTTTCNPNAGGGNATYVGSQRKVFEANGYWWILFATSSNAIDYQSCPATSITSCDTQSAWSSAALFTSVGAAASTSGQGFSAWLGTSGSTYDLIYAVAPTNGGGSFYWGIATLTNTGTVSFAGGMPKDQPFSLLAGHVGTGNPSISVALDGENNLWISVFTHSGTSYYEDVYECQVDVLPNPNGCSSASWFSTTSFLLAENNDILDAPTLLPLVSGSTNYVALLYIDAASAGTGGPMDIYVSPSGAHSGNNILWQSSCGSGNTSTTPTPCSTTSNMTPSTSSLSAGVYVGGHVYGAVSSAGTIYVVAQVSTAVMASFAYTEGATTYSGYDAFLPSTNVNPSLSYSGTNVVVTYVTGGNVVFQWSPMSSVASGADGWSAQTYLAQNTEWGPSNPDASFSSFSVGGYSGIGVIWDNYQWNPSPPTQRIRFAVISMGSGGVVDFPVSVTVSLNQYNNPASANSQISPSNYFVLSYTSSAGQASTAYYTSSTGATMTIPNVMSYSGFLISDQSSASTSAETWCLVYGSSCSNGQGSAFTTLGASDGVALSYYYYDQLFQPSLYAIAAPSIYSVWATSTASLATVNYESTNVGFPVSNAANFGLSPNPASATPWAAPRIQLYTWTTAYDLNAQWVRTRDSTPGCTALTIYENPIPNGGTTCAPSITFQNPFGTSTSASATVLTDTNANWTPGEWVGYKLEYTSGPAVGQSLAITASAATTLTTGSAFSPAPTAGGGDAFTIVQPAVTVNNPAGVTIPGTGPAVQDYVPLQVLNSEGSATAANFQTMITVDSATYRQYEASNLQNVEFFTASGTILPSWLESGNSNTAPSTTYWVNLGTNTVPAGSVGATFASGTTSSATPTVLTDLGATWTASQWVGDYLEYTSGPASGQFLPITANTATTITTQSAFSPAPAAGGGDSFSIVAVNAGSLTIYMGFVPTASNLFSSSGPVGEAPTLSPTYGQYDDGAAVFTALYSNFAGTGLPASFTNLNPASGTFSVSQDNGITISTGTATYGGIVTASGYSTTTPQVFEADVTSVSGVAAGMMAQDGATAASNGYGYNFWGGSVRGGSMSGGFSGPTGSPNLQVSVGIMGQSWVSGTLQYYYKDYALTAGGYSTYALPASAYYSLGEYYYSQASSISLQWVRLRTAPPAGVMPSVTAGPVNPTAAGAVNIVEYIPITITNHQATATPAYYQVDINATSTAYAKYENALLQNVEFFTDAAPLSSSGTVIPSWLESGNSNTALNTVYWVRLPSGVAGGGGTTTIYMGFASVSTNLFASGAWYNGANGYVGEAPTLSPSYGLYDNGANVFNLYDNFAGTSLSANWATDSYFGNTLGAQLTIGKLSTNTCNANLPTATGSGGLSTPGGVAFDSSGNLWVVDRCNNRVLEYAASSLTASNPSPALVIGQASFAIGAPNEGGPVSAAGLFAPTGIAFDSSGNLWVADSGNNRVLEFTAPFSTGEAASTVLGQAAFNTNGAAATASAMNNPSTLAFNSGNLWVVDTSNNRVLEFASASTLPAAGASASVVVGQTSFTSRSSSASATGLWGPTGIAFDSSGNLWVADTLNNRVLEYPSASLSSSGPAASLVVGQAAFAPANANEGSTVNSAGLFEPTSVAFDSSGNLWVADTLNNRILEYPSASLSSSGPSATLVVGQSVLTSGSANGGSSYVNAAGLYTPISLAFNSGNLWVSDMLNNRVLEYPLTSLSSSGPSATLVVGQSVLTSGTDSGNSPSASSLNDPSAQAFDSSGNLWVADTGNNRILEFKAPFYTGEAASLVIGQSSFTTSGSGTTATSLDGPTSIVFDSSGNLWVADTGNNRILEFKAPFSTGETASIVVGQTAFTTSGTGTTASTLNDPNGIAFDSSGNLWVADSGNNRVLEYPSASLSSSGPSATLVVGQGSLTSGTAGTSGTALNDPNGIAFDSSGNLWVADTGNNRVVQFPYSSLSGSGPAATIVIGQTSFTAGSPNGGGNINPLGLNAPTNVAFDNWGELWVADTGNNRVLQYLPVYYGSFVNGQAANYVEGPASWNTGLPNTYDYGSIGSSTLSAPKGLAFDSLDSLWIADSGNNRAWASAAGTATDAIRVDNGLSIRYTSTAIGIVSEATVNPRTNILEMDAYFSSPNSGVGVIGYTPPQSNSPAPQIGQWWSRLYTISTGTIGTSGSILYNGGSGSASLVGYLSIPVAPPTTSYSSPYNNGAGGLEPYPASYQFNAPTNSMCTGAWWCTNWWSLRNTTVTITNALAGASGERWAASPNALLWTINSPFEINPVNLYYHQYADTFRVTAAGMVTTLDPGVTITLTGTLYGQLSAPLATFLSGSTTSTLYVDAGTTVVFPATGVGSPSGVRWENSNNQSQTAILTGPGTCTTLCTAKYYKQFEQYLHYAVSDGTALPSGVNPQLTYYSLGSRLTVPITSGVTPAIIWVDAQTYANATASAAGGSSTQRWVLPNDSWVVTCSNTLASGCVSSTGTTTTGTTATTLQDTSAAWTSGQFAPTGGQVYYLMYTSGPAAGEYLQIISNTATSITTAAFTTAPSPNGGDTFEITGGIPNPVEYYHQFLQQLNNYKTSDYNPITSSSVPKISFSINGTAYSVPLNFTGSTFTGTTSSATANVLTDSAASWTTNQWAGYTLEYTSGPAAGEELVIASNTATTITTASFNPAPSSSTNNFLITYLAWMDAGTTAKISPSVLPGSSPSSEQWVPAIGSWTISGSNWMGGAGGVVGPFGNASILFDHQFQITFQTIPTDASFSMQVCSYPLSTCTTTTYSTSTTPALGTAVWQTTPFIVTEGSGSSIYVPSGIGATSGICLLTSPYTGSCSSLTSSNQAEAKLSASGTVTGYFNLQQGVTFIQTGIYESASDQTTWTVTVTNSTCPTHSCNWSGASSSNALSITLVCTSTCDYNYQVTSDPAYNTADNARYFPTVASGTFQLTASKSATSVSLTFNPQYLLRVVSDPLYTGALTGTWTNSSGTPASGTVPLTSCNGDTSVTTCYEVSLWLDPGSTASFGAPVVTPGPFGSSPPVWLDWSGTGCPTPSSPACTSEGSVAVSAMSGPVSLAANFQVSLSMNLTPSSESAYIGETVTTNAYVFGGVGNITIGAVVPPGLVGLITINFYPLSTPTDQANPLTVPASAYGGPGGTTPIGQTIIMMVQVSSHATLYGALNFTVTASSSGLPWIAGSGAQAICTTTGQLNCIYTLDIISPKATVIGNAQTPFAVTTPGQSSLFYDASNGGHWIAFYYNGSASSGFLVYASSKDANGTIWNAPQRVPSGDAVQGYQYAVTVSNGYVYYVLASNTTLPTTGSTVRWSFFFWNWGQIQSNGLIAWNWNAANKCTAVSEACIQPIPGGGTTAYVAGQPGIAIGQVTGDVYVSIPTLQTSGGALMWRVDVWYSPPAPSMNPSPDTWEFAGSTTAKSISAVNTKIFALTNSIALVDWVGNNLSLPYVTVLNDPPPPIDMLECSPLSAGAASPGLYALYGAQSDVVANGNTLYFAGVNGTNSVVNFYTYTYGSSACGSGVNGGWSSVSQISVGAPTNKLSNWHVSLSWSSGSIIVGYGVDSQLGFAIGTGSGSTWSWFVLPSVQGVSGIQGGLTAAFAPSGSGSGSVGMIWVQKISSTRYAVEFALA